MVDSAELRFRSRPILRRDVPRESGAPRHRRYIRCAELSVGTLELEYRRHGQSRRLLLRILPPRWTGKVCRLRFERDQDPPAILRPLEPHRTRTSACSACRAASRPSWFLPECSVEVLHPARDKSFATMSAVFFWLTNIMIGDGYCPLLRISSIRCLNVAPSAPIPIRQHKPRTSSSRRR